MPTLRLLGAYCNYNGASWNPDSGQPNVQAWKLGRDNFSSAVGFTVNGGNVFTGNVNAAIKGNVAYTMGLIKQVYPNPPYDYIPSVGCKLFQVGEKSPRTGVPYVWNDAKAYQDVADGLWDASWTGLVDSMVAQGRTVWFQRFAYEGNESFMQDFSGFDNQSGQQTPWKAAMRRAFLTIKNYGHAHGCLPLIGFNPCAGTQDNPNAENLFLGIGADVQNCLQFDVYNNYWSLPANLLPADTSGRVPGVGPSQSVSINNWNTQSGGFGFLKVAAMARKYGMPLAIMETGSSGGSHAILNDPWYYPWLASAIQDHRNLGGTCIAVNIWSVPAGDANTNIQFGNQPATLASLRNVINTIAGDPFDPALVRFGGSGGVIPPPPPQALNLSLAGSGFVYGSPSITTITAAVPIAAATQIQLQTSQVAGAEVATLQAAQSLASLGYTPASEVLSNGGLTLTLTLPGGQNHTRINYKTAAVDTVSGAVSNTATIAVNEVYTNFAFVGTTITFNAGRDPSVTDFGASFVPTGTTAIPAAPQVTGATITGAGGTGATMAVSLSGLTTSGPGTIYIYARTAIGTAPPLAVFTGGQPPPPPPPTTVSTSLTAAQFVALWKYCHNYLTVTKGLDNLVWNYSALAPFSTFPQALPRYPGPDFVDINGLDLFSSLPVTVQPTDVITVSMLPTTPVSGAHIVFTGHATLPWSSVGAVYISFGAVQTFVSAQAAGYIVTLSVDQLTATVSGPVAPAAGSYNAYLRDNGIGVTSAPLPYTVTAVPADGLATSVSGLPYLGWGLPLSYPGSFFTAGADNADLVMDGFISNWTKPATMLMYGGSPKTYGEQIFGAQSYINTWETHAKFNQTGLGYKLIPIMGITITTTTGDATFASVQAGARDADIRSLLDVFINRGYMQLVLRISYEDQYATCPSGQGASQVPGYGQFQGAVVEGIPWQFYGAANDVTSASTLAALAAHSTGSFNYADNYIKAWRHFAYVAKTYAKAKGMKLWTVWGPFVFIQDRYFDIRLMDPDTPSYQAADGRGPLVDAHGPDIYFGNVYGDIHLYPGYENNPDSFPFDPTFPTTGLASSKAQFTASIGSEFRWLDFLGGVPSNYAAWKANPHTKLNWSGGWGALESMVWALQNNKAWMIPEFGGIKGTPVSLGAKDTGLNPYNLTAFNYPNYPELARWLRPRIAWFQDANLNGIADGVFLQASFWINQSITQIQGFASVFPEYRNDPFAGRRGVKFPEPF